MAKAKQTKPVASKAKEVPLKKTIKKNEVAKRATKSKAEPIEKPAAKAVKKPVVPAKKTATKKETSAKLLELCLILDCTSSMSSWIERSKDTLKQIIDTVVTQNAGLQVRAAFVAYRDVSDHPRFEVTDFSEDIDMIKSAISR